jgi:hypothetical protein
MFAAPNPDAIRDVEAQRTAGGAAAYPQTDPSMVQKTTITTTAMTGQPVMYQLGQVPQQMQYQQGQYVQGQQGQNGSGANTTADQLPKSTIGRLSHSIHWGTYMFLIAYFSMIVMIAAAQICDVNQPNGSCVATRGYQVSVGIISLFIALICALLDFCGKFETVAGRTVVSVFLFLWWIGECFRPVYSIDEN